MEDSQRRRKPHATTVHDDGDSRVTESKDGRPKDYTQSKAEALLSLIVHATIFLYYACVLVFESNMIERNAARGFAGIGSNTYGGRWKYLTYINMVRKKNWEAMPTCTHLQRFQVVYFLVALMIDCIPFQKLKEWLLELRDFCFITIGFPLTLVMPASSLTSHTHTLDLSLTSHTHTLVHQLPHSPLTLVHQLPHFTTRTCALDVTLLLTH